MNFGKLRTDTDFCDVTLACGDGHQVEAHKVILSTSSPFFEKLLKHNQHTHPLIYMRGMKIEDLSALVDFLYFGEASVAQQNLDSFLSIADELQLVGLSSSEEQGVVQSPNLEGKEASETQNEAKLEVDSGPHVGEVAKQEFTKSEESDQGSVAIDEVVKELGLTGLSLEKITSKAKNWWELNAEKAIDDKFTKRHGYQEEEPDKLSLLSEKISSMMIPSKNKTPNGKLAHTCKVCGKEAQKSNIKHHIERHHMKGWKKDLSSCEFCKVFCSNEWKKNHLLFVHKDKI